MWRNFSFPCMTIVGKLKISPHVEKFQMSPHDRCGEIWNSPHMACVWCRKRRHICKIYAILYALSCGEKLSPKVHLWRKNDKYKVCLCSEWQGGVFILSLTMFSHQSSLFEADFHEEWVLEEGAGSNHGSCSRWNLSTKPSLPSRGQRTSSTTRWLLFRKKNIQTVNILI